MKFTATNNFIYIIRDEIEKETGGLLIPGQGQEKQSTGTVYSVGSLTKDPKIKKSKNRKAQFFKGTGFEMEIEGKIYLVLTDEQIIGVEE